VHLHFIAFTICCVMHDGLPSHLPCHQPVMLCDAMLVRVEASKLHLIEASDEINCFVCVESQARTAAAAADALGQVPPSDALLRCGCRAAVPVQLQLSMVEELFMLTHVDMGPNERHHVREAMLQVSAQLWGSARFPEHCLMSHTVALVSSDVVLVGTPLPCVASWVTLTPLAICMTWLQAPALAIKLHDSGAAARSMLDRLGIAACLMTVIHRLTLPDTSHFGDFRAVKLPVLQVSTRRQYTFKSW
jgi:hypothetical protein